MDRQDVLPDVPAVEAPLIGALLAAADACRARVIDLLGFQARVLELLRALPPREAVAAHLCRALDERRTQVLARRFHGDRDDAVSLVFVAPGESHPCHCHNNVVSIKVVLAGALAAREFDRVGPARAGGVLLRLVFEGMLRAGDYMQVREADRNAHWFAASGGPAVLLDVTLRGYERETFYAPGVRPPGRVPVDATQLAGNGLLLALPLTDAEARRRFGGRPLTDFPMPVPPLERNPRSLSG